MNIKTKCIHGKENNVDYTGAISVPIYQSTTFAHHGVGKSTGYDYSRLKNPTRQQLEDLVTSLEGGVDTVAFSTGMAAISALMELFQTGDHIIASDDLYGGAIRLFNHISEKNGISIDYVNTSDTASMSAKIKANTKAIYLETPTNPMMQVSDISAVSEIAKDHDLLLIVDNTFLTPYYQQPFSLGADIIIHSGTKFLSGHNDTLAGFLVMNSAVLAEKVRFIAKTTGACLAPLDSWLMIRGIKTLSVRMDRQQENAMQLARWLTAHEKVKNVYYVGLESHPQYEISLKQTTGFSSMISFQVDSRKTAVDLLERIRLIYFAESLGGCETLITYPVMQTHADVPEKMRRQKGIDERLLRMSVGLESTEDIINDLKQALD